MDDQRGMDRRSFIKITAFGAVGAGTFLSPKSLPAPESGETEYPRIKSYRTLGRTGFKASDIGIGTARVYPVPVMTALIDAGVNYIDTAEGYGRGEAERSIAEAIKGRDRKSLFITTKIGMRGVDSKEQVVDKVRQCLERLQTDYVDCVMYSGAPSVESLKDENFHQGMDHLRKEGKVRFIGVSNHGGRVSEEGESMEQVLAGSVEDGRFDVLLLVYNFLQKEAGERILDAAARKNVGTTIMKSDPLGRYYQMKARVDQMTREGQEIDERTRRSMAQMEETAKQAEAFIQAHNLKNPDEIRAAALRFVLSNPRVHVLNLAFNTFDDIDDILKLSGSTLGNADKTLMAAFERNCGRLYCRHACGVCEPHCPHHVPVNTIMRYNHYFEAHAAEKFAMEKYARLETAKADLCGHCEGWCERSCPYGVPIQGLLNLAHTRLTLA